MNEILPCRFCGETAFFDAASVLQYWRCPKISCGASGPANDPNGSKWNAMMGGGDSFRDRRRFEAACAAMQGLLSDAKANLNPDERTIRNPAEHVAGYAVQLADALLAALDAGKEKADANV